MITFDSLLVNDYYYNGDSFLTEIEFSNNKYIIPFIKMPLFCKPNEFKNKFFNQKNKQSGIYIIINIITREMYFGSASDLYNRLCNHRGKTDNKSSSKLLQKNIVENGKGFFDVVILFLDNRELCFDIEEYLIKKFIFKEIIFNIATDARKSALGMKHTDESKKLIGLNTINFPRVISEDGRKKKIDAAKKWIRTSEIKKKISIANTGIPCSESKKDKLKVNCYKPWKPIEIAGVEYLGIKDAINKVHLCKNTILKRIKSTLPIYAGYKYV